MTPQTFPPFRAPGHEIIVVPDTAPSLRQAGLVVPGSEYPQPPANQLAVLDAYSRDNNTPAEIVRYLATRGLQLSVGDVAAGLKGVKEVYGVGTLAQAVHAAIGRTGHLKTPIPTDRPAWQTKDAPGEVQRTLTDILGGSRADYKAARLRDAQDFLGASGLGALIRAAHEQGYIAPVPRRMVFALHGQPTRMPRLDEEDLIILDARQRLPDHAAVARDMSATLGRCISEGDARVWIRKLRRRLGVDTTAALVTKAAILGAVAMPDSPKSPLHMPPRRLHVVADAAGGLTNLEIAKRHRLSEATVSTHIRQAFLGLEIHSREQAFHAGLEFGVFVVGQSVRRALQ